jgi:fibronectin-binding autotransporter adhesin
MCCDCLTWLRRQVTMIPYWIVDQLWTFWDWLSWDVCQAIRQELRRTPAGSKTRFVRPSLEALCARITPADLLWVFTGAAGTADYATPGNWTKPPGATTSLPDNQDAISIQAPCVISSSEEADVAQATVTAGNSLTVNGTLDVAPNGNTAGFNGGIGTAAGSDLFDNGTINVSGGGGGGPTVLSGATTVNGAFNLQSGGTSGAYEIMTGAGAINSGGHIDSFGLSDFVIANPAGSPLILNTTGSPGLDQLSNGEIDISGYVSVLNTNTNLSGNIDLTPASFNSVLGTTTPGGNLEGSGSILDQGAFNWSGGTIALGQGFDIGGGSAFQTSGSASKNIQTTLTNDNASTTFGGTGTIGVGGGGTPGTLNNDQPGSTLNLDTSVAVASGSAFVNDGILNVNLPSGTVSVTGLTSDASTSQIDVSAGTTLSLAGSDTLGGTLNNDGATVEVPAGVTTDSITTSLTQNLYGVTGGNFLVAGYLPIAAGANSTFNGGVEVAASGTLAPAAPVTFNGNLTLDPGGSSTLTATDAVNLYGTTIINGASTLSDTTASATVLNGGNLEVAGYGTLSVAGELDNESTLTLGPGDLATVGSLKMDGPLVTQLASDSSYGSLGVTGGPVTFGGGSNTTLTVDLVGGYDPAPGVEYTILTYPVGSRTGGFASANFPNNNWTLTYPPGQTLVTSG